MSEAMTIPPLGEAPAKRTPTVYFIDDSATMREVIKIAFRRENIHVITCADAASALAQFEQTRPDVVITDVIMPDQDGYSVCSQIKQHPEFSEVPVVLMSGVVNKSVADKAVSVKADELIDRKSTRLNSSHSQISYAVFCLKKKKNLIIFYLCISIF